MVGFFILLILYVFGESSRNMYNTQKIFKKLGLGAKYRGSGDSHVT